MSVLVPEKLNPAQLALVNGNADELEESPVDKSFNSGLPYADNKRMYQSFSGNYATANPVAPKPILQQQPLGVISDKPNPQTLKQSLKDRVMAKYKQKEGRSGNSTSLVAGIATPLTDASSNHQRGMSNGGNVNASILQEQISVDANEKQRVKRRQFSINTSTLMPSHGRTVSRTNNVLSNS